MVEKRSKTKEQPSPRGRSKRIIAPLSRSGKSTQISNFVTKVTPTRSAQRTKKPADKPVGKKSASRVQPTSSRSQSRSVSHGAKKAKGTPDSVYSKSYQYTGNNRSTTRQKPSSRAPPTKRDRKPSKSPATKSNRSKSIHSRSSKTTRNDIQSRRGEGKIIQEISPVWGIDEESLRHILALYLDYLVEEMLSK